MKNMGEASVETIVRFLYCFRSHADPADLN